MCFALIFFIFSSCTEHSAKDVLKNSATENEMVEVSTTQFPEYEGSFHDTIFKDWESEGHSEKIELGTYTVDSSEYLIISEFSLIPVADGLRGKSMLYLISIDSDTLSYRANLREELPIDIYENFFVFKGQDNAYIFAKGELVDTQNICFGANWNKCITW